MPLSQSTRGGTVQPGRCIAHCSASYWANIRMCCYPSSTVSPSCLRRRGTPLDKSPAHRRANTHIHTKGEFRVISSSFPQTYVFGLWEEDGESRESPHRHRENMDSPHRRVAEPSEFEPKTDKHSTTSPPP